MWGKKILEARLDSLEDTSYKCVFFFLLFGCLFASIRTKTSGWFACFIFSFQELLRGLGDCKRAWEGGGFICLAQKEVTSFSVFLVLHGNGEKAW